ncbi:MULTISPECIES: cytochrome b6-f complex subunit PetN [unclassified Microcoleus]|uniref:cytochrome b6-f complex subunit PetN n=1 Tax=unclassified Microcoleus TaxID=2642155 RepID=UPI002FCFB02E
MVTIESGYVNPLDLMAMLATIGVTIILRWTPLAALLGFQTLPLSFVLWGRSWCFTLLLPRM